MKTTLTYIKSIVWFAKLVVWFFQGLLPFIFSLLVSLIVHVVSLCFSTVSFHTLKSLFFYMFWVCDKISLFLEFDSSVLLLSFSKPFSHGPYHQSFWYLWLEFSFCFLSSQLFPLSFSLQVFQWNTYSHMCPTKKIFFFFW